METDKNGIILKINDSVFVPTPKGTEMHQTDFVGTVIEINAGWIIVEDMDGDCWVIASQRVAVEN